MSVAPQPSRHEQRTEPRRIALVHDYLVQDGGAERTLLALHEMYPRAPIYTLFHNPKRTHAGFKGADIRTSSLNNLPFAKKLYTWYLPFMPQAIEEFDLQRYDLVISSSSSFAKGLIAAPHALHICYLHTPTRYLWQERMGYVNEQRMPSIVKRFLPSYLHRLRQWDFQAATRPDHILTNSLLSQARIKRYYARSSVVLPPPVDVEQIPLSTRPGTYWLTGGRLVAYKRFDLVVQAFAKLNMPLKIFGEGPELKKLKKMAGPKTEFLGHISETAKKELFREAIAFLHPQIEDFGITAVEAMAAGRPVIAFGQGGATETVLNGITGQFFEVQTWEDIGNAAIRFDPSSYDPRRIRAHAEYFSKEHFKKRIRDYVEQAWSERQQVQYPHTLSS
ncbi:MAG: glycosyltransferase [Candidatus Magasanikbacteria bacterium]|nr:glycosyltransferase [Candidatus Magasanikbacteria bacterium]USN52509.1 MAG: glycosyltransferase [Candidatus Nomurabacteria bacterium]